MLKKAIELSTNLIVYVIIAVIVFLTVWFFFIQTSQSLGKVSPLYKISSLEEARQTCESYCASMKSLSGIDEILTSDYFSKWVSIKVAYQGKVKQVPVKCWWFPVNVYCDSKQQVVTDNGLEEIIIKPFYVPTKEAFDNYVYSLFSVDPDKEICFVVTNQQIKDKKILFSQNGQKLTLTLEEIKQRLKNIKTYFTEGYLKYKQSFEYLATLVIAGNKTVVSSYTIKLVAPGGACT